MMRAVEARMVRSMLGNYSRATAMPSGDRHVGGGNGWESMNWARVCIATATGPEGDWKLLASIPCKAAFLETTQLRTLACGGTLRLMSEQDERNLKDLWQAQSMAAVQQFSEAFRELHQSNPWPDMPLLPRAINHLMTELWDHGFNQTEIREAFNDAMADMPRYAAGSEMRA